MKELEKTIIKILEDYSVNDEKLNHQIIVDWAFQNIANEISDMVREKIKNAFKEIGE